MGSSKHKVNLARRTYFNMKSKLAVFDFDLTIRDPDPGNDWSYGVSHLFPGGKLPEELIEIKKKQGSKTLFKTLIPLVNKMGLTKKELEDCFAYKNGSIIDKMDEVLKVLYDDHDIVMITGNSRAYTDNFLKRYGLFELFEEIFAHPETITDQGKWEKEEYTNLNGDLHANHATTIFARKLRWNYLVPERNMTKSNILEMDQMICIQ